MATPDTTQSLPDEITSSLTAVFKRYATKRPTSASTEIEGHTVRCTMPASVQDFVSAGEADAEAGDADGEARDPADRLVSYRRDLIRAVAKSTHRRVLAQMSEHDAKTDVVTEIFVLEADTNRTTFGEPGWIAS